MTKRCVVRHKRGAYAGWYVKLGGGYTEDLQEAQVVGWSNRSRWNFPNSFELIPVEIRIVEAAPAPVCAHGVDPKDCRRCGIDYCDCDRSGCCRVCTPT